MKHGNERFDVSVEKRNSESRSYEFEASEPFSVFGSSPKNESESQGKHKDQTTR